MKMTTMEMKNKIEPFVTFPRSLASDFRNGKLKPKELLLYFWLRLNANMYGIAVVNLSAVREDIFEDVSENYIEKLLLSLRRKKYVYFPDHRGRRGSFEVHFGDWSLSGGKIKTLDTLFNPKQVTGDGPAEPQVEVQASHSLPAASQTLREQKTQLLQQFSMDDTKMQVRGSYNDTDNQKENYIDDISLDANKRVSVRSFTPQSYEQQRCHEIAKKLGEEHMNFILSVYHKHGLDIIERAYGLYREEAATREIKNPPAYFNGILKSLLSNDNAQDKGSITPNSS